MSYPTLFVYGNLSVISKKKGMNRMMKNNNSLFSGYEEDNLALEKLSKKDRDALPDEVFGLPEVRKYPLDTKERIKDAISFFHFCKSEKDRKILAHNIAQRINFLQIQSDFTFKNTSLITRYFTEGDKATLNIVDTATKEKTDKIDKVIDETGAEESYIGSMMAAVEIDDIESDYDGDIAEEGMFDFFKKKETPRGTVQVQRDVPIENISSSVYNKISKNELLSFRSKLETVAIRAMKKKGILKGYEPYDPKTDPDEPNGWLEEEYSNYNYSDRSKHGVYLMNMPIMYWTVEDYTNDPTNSTVTKPYYAALNDAVDEVYKMAKPYFDKKGLQIEMSDYGDQDGGGIEIIITNMETSANEGFFGGFKKKNRSNVDEPEMEDITTSIYDKVSKSELMSLRDKLEVTAIKAFKNNKVLKGYTPHDKNDDDWLEEIDEAGGLNRKTGKQTRVYDLYMPILHYDVRQYTNDTKNDNATKPFFDAVESAENEIMKIAKPYFEKKGITVKVKDMWTGTGELTLDIYCPNNSSANEGFFNIFKKGPKNTGRPITDEVSVYSKTSAKELKGLQKRLAEIAINVMRDEGCKTGYSSPNKTIKKYKLPYDLITDDPAGGVKLIVMNYDTSAIDTYGSFASALTRTRIHVQDAAIQFASSRDLDVETEYYDVKGEGNMYVTITNPYTSGASESFDGSLESLMNILDNNYEEEDEEYMTYMRNKYEPAEEFAGIGLRRAKLIAPMRNRYNFSKKRKELKEALKKIYLRTLNEISSKEEYEDLENLICDYFCQENVVGKLIYVWCDDIMDRDTMYLEEAEKFQKEMVMAFRRNCSQSNVVHQLHWQVKDGGIGEIIFEYSFRFGPNSEDEVGTEGWGPFSKLFSGGSSKKNATPTTPPDSEKMYPFEINDKIIGIITKAVDNTYRTVSRKPEYAKIKKYIKRDKSEDDDYPENRDAYFAMCPEWGDAPDEYEDLIETFMKDMAEEVPKAIGNKLDNIHPYFKGITASREQDSLCVHY